MKPPAPDTDMVRDASISPDGKYRWSLTRTWDMGGTVVWVMCNPSTADADVDDPTIRRCIGFSKGWGYGSLVVVNLNAFRATDPRILRYAPDSLATNLNRVRGELAAADLVVAGWGTNAAWADQTGKVRAEVAKHNPQCLGVTQAGHPKHPLYVRADTLLTPWVPR